jgi:Dolichyl-phosphate-mannose-protein mannosyltransferase
MDGEGFSSPRARVIALAVILGVGLGLRLAPVFCHGRYPVLFMDPDSWEYHRLASNLLAGNGYSWDTAPPYSPNLYRTPGLPVLLTGLYAVTGPSIPAAILLQAVVSTTTVLLTYVLARALTRRPGIALIAAAVQALDPVAIQYSNILLTENFTSLLLLLIAICLWRYWQTTRSGWLLAVGAILAVGILFHPVLLFVPPALPVIALAMRRCRTWRHFGVALGAAVVAVTPATAWIIRNRLVGDFTGISSVTAVNLLKYKAAGVEAELRGTSRETERDRLTRECEAELPSSATAGDQFRLWQHRGSSIVLAHPLTYAKIHVRGMALEVFGPERDHTTRLLYGPAALNSEGQYTDASTAAARTERAVPILEVTRYAILAWQSLLMIGAMTGTALLLRRQPGLLAVLLVVPLYVLALSGGPEASPRFRVIYLPVLSLLTAESLAALSGGARWIWSRQFPFTGTASGSLPRIRYRRTSARSMMRSPAPTSAGDVTGSVP